LGDYCLLDQKEFENYILVEPINEIPYTNKKKIWNYLIPAIAVGILIIGLVFIALIIIASLAVAKKKSKKINNFKNIK
jgi:hypothetical protein